ncbi:hypothetical protein [Pareuzebyella sediminis]|nr:hypothetical protein [Pareuzebyella sediminis]
MNDKRFKRKKEQHDPTNPTGNTKIRNDKFDINDRTINEQRNKQ